MINSYRFDSNAPITEENGSTEALHSETGLVDNGAVPATPEHKRSVVLWRNLIAFWFFGLCNNFAYVIMLSAAHDILVEQNNETKTTEDDLCNSPANTTKRICNQLSTGAVLLADIIPTLIVKLSAPLFMQRIPYGTRSLIVIICQIISYLTVSFSPSVAISLLGVVFASIGAGLGEITFLSLGAHFDKNVISTWSSGTGGAGLFGALSYAGLTFYLSPRNTVLVMLVVPVIMAVCYWWLVVFPPTVHQIIFRPELSCVDCSTCIVPSDSTGGQLAKSVSVANSDDECDEREALLGIDYQREDSLIDQPRLGIKEKLKLILPLLKYMIPLGCVYMGEYFINQGLQELIYFHTCWLKQADQYRWYQVLYQFGVFISRSSVNLLHIPSSLLPVLAALQFVNAGLFFCEAYFLFIPSIWIVFALIFYEGLLGGAAYVNTFYQIRQEVDPRYVEYSLGVASVADSTGIVIAGFLAIPAHNWICKEPLPLHHY